MVIAQLVLQCSWALESGNVEQINGCHLSLEDTSNEGLCHKTVEKKLNKEKDIASQLRQTYKKWRLWLFYSFMWCFQSLFFKINWVYRKESYKVIIWKNVISSNCFWGVVFIWGVIGWTCQMNFLGGITEKDYNFFHGKFSKYFSLKHRIVGNSNNLFFR